jgi:hemerythrin-like domain-containing protein
MLPIGPLMIEHRLIERMIQAMKSRLENIQAGEKVDSALIDRFIHFIRTYADHCHHGKEEDILFRELAKKKMRPEHKRILGELIEEHKFGRQITWALAEANQRYQKGETDSLSAITENLKSLLEFYPGHIKKEDKDFFLPIMEYFSPEEKEAMIREGYELDSRLFHREYEDLVALRETTALRPERE